MVEFLSGAALSGVLYDMMKSSAVVTANDLKARLKDWILSDDTAVKLTHEISNVGIDDSLSEKAIFDRLERSSVIHDLLQQVTQPSVTTNHQVHTGSGDNVAGDKIINH